MSLAITRKSIQLNSQVFFNAWEIYLEAFPEEERRDKCEQENLLKTVSNYHCDGIFQQDTLVGIFFWWDFPALRFIEHFATLPSYRNKGLGKMVIETFIAEKDTPVILEVELPEDNLKQRRIKFYQRLGFHLNPIEYLQPPYRIGSSFTSLLLASYPMPLSPSLSSYFATECLPLIYREYYNSLT